MGITTRKRDVTHLKFGSSTVTRNRGTGQVVQNLPATQYVISRQTTTSEGHPWPPSEGDKVRDIGGEFRTEKYEINLEGLRPMSVSYDSLANRTTFYGVPFIYPWSSASSTGLASLPAGPGPLTKTQLLAKGTTAISRTLPTAPQASIAVTLGELIREGIPLFGKETIQAFRGQRGDRPFQTAADEGLAYQFGLSPLISEVRKTSEAVRESNKIIAQLKRDSGRLVRRKYDFPIERSTEVETASGVYPANIPSSYFSKGGDRTLVKRLTRRVYFRGGYTYFYNIDGNTLSTFEKYSTLAKRVLGLDFKPEVLWNLAPWSWLVDWETNVGDIITNASYIGHDGLVLRYGYIMEHYVYQEESTLKGLVDKIGNPLPPITQSSTRVVKTRLKATPYGFGLNPDGFSAKQWAILAALGISRGSRQL